MFHPEEEMDHSKINGEVPARPAPAEIHKEPEPPCVPGNPLNLPDGVGRGIYYSKIKLPECGYLEVCVTHVIHPHQFWVMLIENWPKLQDLTEDMRFVSLSVVTSWLVLSPSDRAIWVFCLGICFSIAPENFVCECVNKIALQSQS